MPKVGFFVRLSASVSTKVLVPVLAGACCTYANRRPVGLRVILSDVGRMGTPPKRRPSHRIQWTCKWLSNKAEGQGFVIELRSSETLSE